MTHWLVIGLGYTGAAIARAAVQAGFAVTATTRTGVSCEPIGPALRVIPFAAAGAALADGTTHLVLTAAPGPDGQDPTLAAHAEAVAAAPALRWIGYLSSTSVYGDRGARLLRKPRRSRPAPRARAVAPRPKPLGPRSPIAAPLICCACPAFTAPAARRST